MNKQIALPKVDNFLLSWSCAGWKWAGSRPVQINPQISGEQWAEEKPDWFLKLLRSNFRKQCGVVASGLGA